MAIQSLPARSEVVLRSHVVPFQGSTSVAVASPTLPSESDIIEPTLPPTPIAHVHDREAENDITALSERSPIHDEPELAENFAIHLAEPRSYVETEISSLIPESTITESFHAHTASQHENNLERSSQQDEIPHLEDQESNDHTLSEHLPALNDLFSPDEPPITNTSNDPSQNLRPLYDISNDIPSPHENETSASNNIQVSPLSLPPSADTPDQENEPPASHQVSPLLPVSLPLLPSASITEEAPDEASVRLAQTLSEANTRRMRKRTFAQIYPYSSEMMHYKTQVRSVGIRPTRLVDVNDDVQLDPSVRFEDRPPHIPGGRPHGSAQRPVPAQRSNSDPHSVRRNEAQQVRSLTKAPSTTQPIVSRRVILDSEDELSDLESRVHTRRQQIFFSDTDDELSQEKNLRVQSDTIDTWDPLDSDGSSLSELSQGHSKGALPASFIPELPDADDAVATAPRRGIGINKKGLEKHTVRREIPENSAQAYENNDSSMQFSPTREISDVEMLDAFENNDFEVTAIRQGNHGSRRNLDGNQQPAPVYQSDIRNFGNPFDGAEEFDEVDHMVTRAYRPRNSNGPTRTRRLNGGYKTRAVAVSQNPRRTPRQPGARRPTKRKVTSQSMPANRYQSSIIQNFVDSFQHGPSNHRSTLPGLRGHLGQRTEGNTGQPNGISGVGANKNSSKRKKSRPLAVVSGLHTPRNKPQSYTSIFQVESGSYAPRIPRKRPQPRPHPPMDDFEYPATAFDDTPHDFDRPAEVSTSREMPIAQSDAMFDERSMTNPEHRARPSLQLSMISEGLPAAIHSRHPLDELNYPGLSGSETRLSVEQNPYPAPEEIQSEYDFQRPVNKPVNRFQELLNRPAPPRPEPRSQPIMDISLTQVSFSFNFKLIPFSESFQFEKNSFVGQGIFENIIRGLAHTSSVQPIRSGYFGPEIGMLKWGPWDQEVISAFERSCEVIVRWITNPQDIVTSEHTESSYFYWKFVNEYFFDETINYSDALNAKVLETVGKTVKAIMDSWKASSTKSALWHELSLTSIAFLLTLIIPAIRRNNVTGESSIIFHEASTFLLKRLLASFNEISDQVSKQRSRKNMPLGGQKPSYLMEISYMIVQLIDTGSEIIGTPSFLQTAKACVKLSLEKASEIEQNEVVWQTLFLFNVFYYMRDRIHGTPKAGWEVVNSLVVPFFQSVQRTPGIVSQAVANYAKALLARCLILLTTWNWRPDRDIIKAVYSCFASIRYANLEPRDVGHGLPPFLMKASLSSSYAYPALEDTIFHVFLKLLAVCLKAYKRTMSRQLRRLVDSVNVLNNFTYPPRDAEVQIIQLESLANQYSLLLTRFKYSSKTAQPPLEQLVGLFSLENSHLRARELTVDAWKVVAEIQLKRNQPLTSAMHWYDQLLGKAFDEYLQLDNVTGSSAALLDKREIQRRKGHLQTYEEFLFRPLRYVNIFLSDRITLVKSTYWKWLLRKLFMRVLASNIREELRLTILDMLRAYIASALYMRAAECPPSGASVQDEDSQALDFVLPVQSSDRNEIVISLARHYSNTIQIHSYKEFLNGLLLDENTNTDLFVCRSIDLWADAAQFLVDTKEQDWQAFYYSWQWFHGSKRRAMYEPYWLASFLKVSGLYYKEEETKVLQDMMKYLVCVYPIHEQRYVAAVFDKTPEILKNCIHGLKEIPSREFAKNRLAIIHGKILVFFLFFFLSFFFLSNTNIGQSLSRNLACNLTCLSLLKQPKYC